MHCAYCEGTKINGPWGKKGRIQQIAGTKKLYRPRNDNGGRKCVMSQAPGYGATFSAGVNNWHGYARRLEALELRAELVAKIAASRAVEDSYQSARYDIAA